jgi:small-conductance mechanosensitive channel
VNAFWQWFQQALGTPSPAQRQVYATVVVIVFTWVIRRIAHRTLERRVVDAHALYQWRKAITYATAVFAFLVIGGIWFQGFQSVSTFLGLLSAGLAVALQDPIVNLAGWLFIVWRRPFDVGDRIQIGEHRGDVIDIRIFQFSLMEVGNWVEADQSTGRVIHIPNGKIFRETQANYSKGFQYIWNEIPVLVTFESNWKRAKDILQDIAQRYAEHISKSAEEKLHQAAKKFMIVFTRLTPAVFTSVADSGVLLTIRYLCEPKRRRVTTQEIWEAILEEFSQCDDIDFAYPTYRFYDNPVEGKSDARAPLPPATGPQGFVVKD